MYNNFEHERENNNKGERKKQNYCISPSSFRFLLFICWFVCCNDPILSHNNWMHICTICVLCVQWLQNCILGQCIVLFCHWFLCAIAMAFEHSWGRISSVQGILKSEKKIILKMREIYIDSIDFTLDLIFVRFILNLCAEICVSS